MGKKVILQLRDDGNLYDANGMLVIGTLNMNYVYFEPESNINDVTLQLIKQGVCAEEIIKLKNQDLIK